MHECVHQLEIRRNAFLTRIEGLHCDAVATVNSPCRWRHPVNKDIIAGKWTQLKGKAQAKWGDLTDDVFDVAQGDSNYLAGKLQEKYGWERDRAEREVNDFGSTLN
jgi:uncharacterized protein YjbJ (UPF0337 family)